MRAYLRREDGNYRAATVQPRETLNTSARLRGNLAVHMGINIQLSAAWTSADGTLDLAELGRILHALVESQTVRGAANTLELSYRTVWGRLEQAEALLGQPLIEKCRGRGSELTRAGQRLLDLLQQLDARMHTAMARDIDRFEHQFMQLFAGAAPPLRLACNFDPVLDECLQEAQLPGWSVDYMGTQKVAAALLDRQADVIGFHQPISEHWPEALSMLKHSKSCFLSAVMEREVGLVVAHGNPLHIRGVADLVRDEVRFINRQRNAGMRRWFDTLLSDAGITPDEVNGYCREEFTHMAVATAVAAGTADVCFTLRAVAETLNVDFIPVGKETYFLAGRADLAGDPRLNQLMTTLAEASASHVGYVAPKQVASA